MKMLTLARHAMATRFEMVLHGDDPVRLRAAGEEALDEVERLESQLSLFRTSSEIAHLNARAALEPVRVTPALFALLEHAKVLHQETQGAFDITIAPLVRCWGFMGGKGVVAKKAAVAAAMEIVGMQYVQLNREERTVRFLRPGVMLDLGAIGKGYAIERAAELLQEAGITSALLHGGTSTVYALGCPPGAESWQVAIENPDAEHKPGAEDSTGLAPLALVPLKDEAVSVSAVWGRSFESGGKTYGHVIDPRTGQPANSAICAAVVCDSATESDALSTALLTLGLDGHERIAQLRRNMRTLVAAKEGAKLRILAKGIFPANPQMDWS